MDWGAAQALRRAAFRFAALTVETRLARLMLLAKAGFRADQPRVPAGNPDGGRWTDGAIPVNSRGPRSGRPRRVGGRWQSVTPDQEARLAVSLGDMQAMLRAVRRLDPGWRPRPSLYGDVEGQIVANNGVAREARVHLYNLTASPPSAGPFAKEWMAASPNLRLNREQQLEINRIGRAYGCH